MTRIITSTWAPTTLAGLALLKGQQGRARRELAAGKDLQAQLLGPVRRAEELGIDQLLVAQRWWGTGREIEGSSHDCLAMTAFYAATTTDIRLVTAIHPGFFLPAAVAKWGATIDRLSGGRWAVNITSGWHEEEFGMFGASWLDHDERYARSSEFIQVLRGAWEQDEFSFNGRFYAVDRLRLEPRPVQPGLTVFQGGQSAAALDLAATRSDWMFLNGGPPEKIGPIIAEVRRKAAATGRHVRFALYAIPHCRASDEEAEREVAAMVASIDSATVADRHTRVSGAQGMWRSPEDPLTSLDSNEGFASRLIGSPGTILRRMHEFQDLGVECFHLTLHDERFNAEVLPRLNAGIMP